MVLVPFVYHLDLDKSISGRSVSEEVMAPFFKFSNDFKPTTSMVTARYSRANPNLENSNREIIQQEHPE